MNASRASATRASTALSDSASVFCFDWAAACIIKHVFFMFAHTDPRQSFPALENEVIKFWKENRTFQRSLEIHCDEVLMGKNGVDGVYTADPRKDENAKRFETLSYNRALVDNLAVMDASALSMARDNKKRIRVFGLEEPGNVTRALVGDDLV